MRVVRTADERSYGRLNNRGIAQSFSRWRPFPSGCTELVYTDVDRAIIGGVVPATEPLMLQGGWREMACEFCARREVGVINLGAPRTITGGWLQLPAGGARMFVHRPRQPRGDFCERFGRNPGIFLSVIVPCARGFSHDARGNRKGELH